MLFFCRRGKSRQPLVRVIASRHDVAWCMAIECRMYYRVSGRRIQITELGTNQEKHCSTPASAVALSYSLPKRAN